MCFKNLLAFNFLSNLNEFKQVFSARKSIGQMTPSSDAFLFSILLQLEFVPSPSGAYQFASVNPRYFNKLDCNDVFKKIESKTADGLANDMSKALREMHAPPLVRQPVEETQPTHAQKRPLTPLFREPCSSKRQKGASNSESGHVKSVQGRCDDCQLDSKYPVNKKNKLNGYMCICNG